MEIVFLDSDTVDLKDISLKSLTQLGKLKMLKLHRRSSFPSSLTNTEVLISNKIYIGKKELASCPSLKLICVAATGVNNIDIQACQNAGVAICNVAGYSTQSVAEHALMFMLNFAHRFKEHDQSCLDHSWSKSPQFAFMKFPYSNLSEKSLGLIGYGNIGKKVAHLAKSFDMKVLIAEIPGRKYQAKRPSLKKVLKQSDYICLHTALTEKTFQIINEKTLSEMKTSAFLINLARGALVDERALAKALKNNQLAGYASDVMCSEPPQSKHPLLAKNLKNKVLLSPHIAWASLESRQKIIEEIAMNIQAFFQKKKRNRII